MALLPKKATQAGKAQKSATTAAAQERAAAAANVERAAAQAKQKAAPGNRSTPTAKPTQQGAQAPGQQPPSPFLTAAQQYKLQQYDSTIGQKMIGLQRTLGDTTAKTNAEMAANVHTHDVNTNNVNQVTAARGMFQSSIRAGELNDIDTTLTMKNNILGTALQTLNLNTTKDINTLTTDWASTHNYYNTLAASNAFAQEQPGSTPPAPSGQPSQAAPAQPKQTPGFSTTSPQPAAHPASITPQQAPPSAGGAAFTGGFRAPIQTGAPK